jgi:hypothetical protein
MGHKLRQFLPRQRIDAASFADLGEEFGLVQLMPSFIRSRAWSIVLLSRRLVATKGRYREDQSVQKPILRRQEFRESSKMS